MKNLRRILFSIAMLVLAAGCAQIAQPPLKPLDPAAATRVGNQYAPKVDNFQVILDASKSMQEGAGDKFHANNFLVARDIVSRINQGIPTDLNYNAALSSFGHNGQKSKNLTELLYGMTTYRQADFHDGLNKIKYIGGSSPMSEALRAAGSTLQAAGGKSALIVVSDGLDMADAPQEAEKIKAMLGDNLCIYSIAIGNERNGAGHKVMQAIADAGGCGFATSDAELADSSNMAAFIKDVLLTTPPPPKPKPAPKPAVIQPPGDRDGDGVTDDKDKCPDTPRGEMVDEDGCTLKMTIRVNFDFDKAVVKPEFKYELDKAAAFILKHKDVPYILLAGHTDHIGTIAYNQKLSEERAAAVKKYLVENYQIDPKRLYTKGYGKTQPIADNATDEGRYLNRRVEIICCVVMPE